MGLAQWALAGGQSKALSVQMKLLAGAVAPTAIYYWEQGFGQGRLGLHDVPGTSRQISAEWLTSMLAPQYPGVRIERVEIVFSSQGSSSHARLKLQYAPGADAGLPATMFAKTTNTLWNRVMTAGTGSIRQEVLFYAGLRNELPINAPRAFLSLYGNLSRRSLVLTTDLAADGAEVLDARHPLQRAEMERMLEEVSAFHAPLWNSPRLNGDLSWLQRFDKGGVGDFFRALDMGCSVGFDRGLAEGVIPSTLADAKEKIRPAMLKLWNEINLQGPATFLHGDLHLGNLFIGSDGRPGAFDWQMIRRGSWAHDVAYLIAGGLNTEDRRAWERDLIGHYVECLRAHNVKDAPGAEEAWFRYRQQMAWGVTAWLNAMGDGSLQGPEVSRLTLARYANAFADLETLKAIGA